MPTEKLHLEEDRCPPFSVRQVCLEKGLIQSEQNLKHVGEIGDATMWEDGYLGMIPL